MVQKFANNHYIISVNGAIYFQSYNSVVARVDDDSIILSNHWNYSNTTTKYLYKFLRHVGFEINGKKDVLEWIKNGDAILLDEDSIPME